MPETLVVRWTDSGRFDGFVRTRRTGRIREQGLAYIGIGEDVFDRLLAPCTTKKHRTRSDDARRQLLKNGFHPDIAWVFSKEA